MTVHAPTPLVPRDQYERPLIIPPGGGKAIPYTRVTTWANTIDDRWALEKWGNRMVALGLADRPDLLLAVTAHRDDREALNDIVEKAAEAAKSTAAATRGTALHKLTEMVDRGDEIPTVPVDVLADLAAYEDGTKDLTVHKAGIEVFVVVDELKVAGTFDRLVTYQGVNHIADLKTGSTLDYGMGGIAMQLALYSRGEAYDPATGNRYPLPDVNQERGIVIHLPAGEAKCHLYWVDISNRGGWEAVGIVKRVRAYRAYTRNLWGQL